MAETALIGFGEAARAFAGDGAWRGAARAFDPKLLDPAARAEVAEAAAAARVALAGSPAQALAGAPLALSLVTADQALAAARAGAAHLAAGALWCDMNSVSPGTKRAAAAVVEAAGGRYVDVAVMAAVRPVGLAAPLLVSGPHAEAAMAALAERGFTNARALPGPIGRASAVKMIRSVVVKGLEALTAEMVLGAEAAGVLPEVLASLDASERPRPWAERAAYNLERMATHGARRAAEMEEVARTLDELGAGSWMSRATVVRQRLRGGAGAEPERDAA